MDALADLPGDVLVAILVRLPARSIARCREVCRAWRSAISHPSFDIAHAERPAAVVKLTADDQWGDFDLDIAHGAMGPMFFTKTTVVFDLFRGRWHRDNVHINPPSNRALILGSTLMNLGLGGSDDLAADVRGSWDGVVCIEFCSSTAVPLSHPYHHADQYVLWNPVTLACATVSPPPGDGGEIIGAYSHPSTRRFHLVHASGKTAGDRLVVPTTFRILSVGDAVWREIPLEEESKISMTRHHARCVRSHGNLHWLVLWGSEPTLRLLTFDATREKFRLTEAPPTTRQQGPTEDDDLTMARLGVLSGGELCTFIVEPSTSTMDLWVVDKYDEAMTRSSWWLKERISLVSRDRSDLSRTFCMDTDVEVVEGVREGEEIFLRRSDDRISGSSRIDAYNLRCKEWHEVNVSRSARTVMHRESVLQGGVSFGGASRALSRTVDRNGRICYTL